MKSYYKRVTISVKYFVSCLSVLITYIKSSRLISGCFGENCPMISIGSLSFFCNEHDQFKNC